MGERLKSHEDRLGSCAHGSLGILLTDLHPGQRVIATAGEQRNAISDLFTGNHDGPRRIGFQCPRQYVHVRYDQLHRDPRNSVPLAIDHADVNRTGTGLG